MNTSKLTMKQCIGIIENNYLGTYTKSGKQKDYGDYKQAINERLWSLQDKAYGKLRIDTPEWVTEANISLKSDYIIDINKIFNRWRYISIQLGDK